MTSVVAVKEVKVCGSSYVVYLTKELRMIGAEPKDKIELEIRKTD